MKISFGGHFMMNFLRRLFRKRNKRIKFNGDGGLWYQDDDKLYYVDSEHQIYPPYHYTLSTKGVYYYENGQMGELVPEDEKKKILKKVKLDLESKRLKVELVPDIYLP